MFERNNAVRAVRSIWDLNFGEDRELKRPLTGNITEADVERADRLNEKWANQVHLRAAYNQSIGQARRNYVKVRQEQLKNEVDAAATRQVERVAIAAANDEKSKIRKLAGATIKQTREQALSAHYQNLITGGN